MRGLWACPLLDLPASLAPLPLLRADDVNRLLLPDAPALLVSPGAGPMRMRRPLLPLLPADPPLLLLLLPLATADFDGKADACVPAGPWKSPWMRVKSSVRDGLPTRPRALLTLLLVLEVVAVEVAVLVLWVLALSLGLA